MDEAGRTWQYDPETETERIFWDLWGPPVDDAWRNKETSDRHVAYDQVGIEEVVTNGWRYGISPTTYGSSMDRRGPYGRHEWNYISFYFGNDYKWEEQLVDWGVSELYQFRFDIYGGRNIWVIAPDVGVVYYTTSILADGKVLVGEYTLRTFEREEKVTAVEDVSFGQIKQQMMKPPPRNDP